MVNSCLSKSYHKVIHLTHREKDTYEEKDGRKSMHLFMLREMDKIHELVHLVLPWMNVQLQVWWWVQVSPVQLKWPAYTSRTQICSCLSIFLSTHWMVKRTLGQVKKSQRQEIFLRTTTTIAILSPNLIQVVWSQANGRRSDIHHTSAWVDGSLLFCSKSPFDQYWRAQPLSWPVLILVLFALSLSLSFVLFLFRFLSFSFSLFFTMYLRTTCTCLFLVQFFHFP